MCNELLLETDIALEVSEVCLVFLENSKISLPFTFLSLDLTCCRITHKCQVESLRS